MANKMFRGESVVRAVPQNGSGTVDWIEVAGSSGTVVEMSPIEAVRLAYLLLAEAANAGLVADVDSRRVRRKFASRQGS